MESRRLAFRPSGLAGFRRGGLLVLLVLAWAAQAWAQGMPAGGPAAEQIILPGQAIGRWSLDMSFADLVWQLGVRTVELSSPGPQYRSTQVEFTQWSDPPVVAIHSYSDNRVYALGIAATGYRTHEGIGVGATEDAITAAYGPTPTVVQLPPRPKLLIYNNRGVAFQVAFSPAAAAYGAVERVFVFRPGEAAAIWRAQ